ncbi:MAG: PPC domain-containing protein [Anaerolineaceae bacterium]|nr:PPC domain-containing protein [Anaerolineaceae bacterium]
MIGNKSLIRITRMMLVLGVCLMIALVAVQAQSVETLVAGEPTTSTLDLTTVARFFQFEVAEASDVEITITSEDLVLAAALNDADGNTVAQAIDLGSTGMTTLIATAEPGTYSLVVFVARGSENAEGSFEVVLNDGDAQATEEPTSEPVEATPTPAAADETPEPSSEWTTPTQILLANGIEVRLSWTAAVDLGLEVRDPVGNTLYFDSRTSPVGGSFGFDANGLCEVITENPTETASWVPGFLPTGSYEILVFYYQACDQSVPAAFTIDVTVDGQAQPTIEGALSPPPNSDVDSVYLASFDIDPDGSVQVYDGDFYPDTSLGFLPAPVNELVDEAQPIAVDEVAAGVIYREQPYQSYVFQGVANDVVNISLEATSGNLDTLVQVMDASGTLLQVVDDAAGTTNSIINNLRLPNSGQYYVIATRYGKELGGTEGEYTLTLASGVQFTSTDLTALNLPVGDISVLLTWNNSTDLQLLVRDPVGDSVYDDAAQINSGGQLLLNGNVQCVRAEGTPTSYIYWPQGFLRAGIYEVDVWFQSTCNDATAVEFTLTILVNGQPLVQEVRRPTLDQHFVVNFTVGPDGQPSAGQGGFVVDNATGIDYTSEVPVAITFNTPATGTIAPDNAFDVYTFDGSAGQTVTISMNAISQTLDTKLLLIAPSGIQVAENDDADPLLANTNGRTTNSLIASYTLQETGPYTIIATRYGIQFGGTIGAYRVLVEG